MKLIFAVLFGLLVGVCLGALFTYVFVHIEQKGQSESATSEIPYVQLFALSETKIAKENFACEQNLGDSVGQVLAAILQANRDQFVSQIHEGCDSGKCFISHSNCLPWQSDSCGSTILLFNAFDKLTGGAQIDPNSIQCLQVP